MIIEKAICDYLEDKLGISATPEHPSDKPDSYVLVEKIGSRKVDRISRSTIAIQSYAKSMYEAAKLNEEVKAAVEKIIEEDDISSVKLNSDYNFTDTSRKHYRYQAIYEITHY